MSEDNRVDPPVPVLELLRQVDVLVQTGSLHAEAWSRVRDAILTTSDRLEAEAARSRNMVAFVVKEAEHRLSNLLSEVEAMVGFYWRKGTPEQFERMFCEAIRHLPTDSLSTALVSDRRDILELVAPILRRHFQLEDASRYSLEGPCTSIGGLARSAVLFAVEELSTNARKHGALSRGGGTLEVRWSTPHEDGTERLTLTWLERCSFQVTKPDPARAGKGSRLLRHDLCNLFDATTTLEWRNDGLTFVMDVPLTPAVRRPVRGAARESALTVLLVDDLDFVRGGLAASLELMGCQTTEAGDVDGALHLLAALPPPDVAVLDRQLDGTVTFAVADQLKRQAIPFLFLAGDLEFDDWGGHEGELKLKKPISTDLLVEHLEALWRERSR